MYINKYTSKANKLTVKCFSFRDFLNILHIIFANTVLRNEYSHKVRFSFIEIYIRNTYFYQACIYRIGKQTSEVKNEVSIAVIFL